MLLQPLRCVRCRRRAGANRRSRAADVTPRSGAGCAHAVRNPGTPRSTRSSAAMQSAARQHRRVQQFAQLVRPEARHLERHVEDRTALGVGALGDGRRALVPDDGIQRRREDGIARQRVRRGAPRRARRPRCIAPPARARRSPAARCWSAGCCAIIGSITLSWKLPDCPPMAMAASRPITCAAIIAHGFGNHRVDLARHDAAARLQGRQLQLAEARERTGTHPAQVVGDLHQRHRQRAQLAGEFHGRVLRSLRREVVWRTRERHRRECAQVRR